MYRARCGCLQSENKKWRLRTVLRAIGYFYVRIEIERASFGLRRCRRLNVLFKLSVGSALSNHRSYSCNLKFPLKASIMGISHTDLDSKKIITSECPDFSQSLLINPFTLYKNLRPLKEPLNNILRILRIGYE